MNENDLMWLGGDDELFDSLAALRDQFGQDSALKLAQARTLVKLRGIGGAREVGKGQSIVSSRPLASFAYGHCRALVVRRFDQMGLSHLLLDQDPTDFVEFTRRKLDHLVGIAVTVGPDNNEVLQEISSSNNIRVVDTIVVDGETLNDIITMPQSGEFVVCTAEGQEIVRKIPVEMN